MKIRSITGKALIACTASAITAILMSEQGRESLKVAHEAGMDAVEQRRKARAARRSEHLRD